MIFNSMTLTTSVQSRAVLKSSGVLQSVVVIVYIEGLCAQLSPKTQKRKGRKEKWTQRMWHPPHLFQFLFPPLSLYSIPLASPLMQPCTHGRLCVSQCVRPFALSLLCPESEGALEGYSLSMSLYFFRSMDTWSLNSTGSSLI